MEFQLGQKVRLRHTGEVGVVVWLWTDEHGDTDAYVSFFGDSFPSGVPVKVSYVLRYYAAGLEPVE